MEAVWSPTASQIAAAVVTPPAEGSSDCCVGRVWLVDPATGAAIKTSADVNTTKGTGFSDLPSGWTMPPDGGRHLITTMEVDARARTTKQTDPDGTITFTVYNDASHEVRTYAGWRYNSTSEEYYAATNAAITVSREDWANNNTETLTYVWTGAGQDALPVSAVDGRPLGTEPLNSAYVSLQSLSRSLMSEAGFDLLKKAAPAHVDSVRRVFVDAMSPEDYVALGRAMSAVLAVAD